MLLMTVATQDVARKLALLHEILRAQGHDLVAVQNGALLVHHDEAIGVAVQSKPDIGPRLADLRGQPPPGTGNRSGS